MCGTDWGYCLSFLSLTPSSCRASLRPVLFCAALMLTWGIVPAAAQDAVETAPEAPAQAEGEAGPQKAEKKKLNPVNPLNRLIQGIFGGAKPQGRIIPKNPQNARPQGAVKDPANGDESARDRIDARAPLDPQMAKLLRRAGEHMDKARQTGEEREWKLALDILKYLLDPARPSKPNERVEDALVRGPDGQWTTMRREANRLLAEFPSEQLAAYRQEFSGLARRMFEEAKDNGNVEQMVIVATQFFHTPSGTAAANWMGMRHFDHAEFGMAARWFRQLLKHEAAITQDPQWQIKAAVTFHQAGDEETSGQLLAKLNGHSLVWGKQTLPPSEFLARIGRRGAVRVPTLDDWPVLYGSASHLGKARGGDPLLLPRWHQPLTNSRTAREWIEESVDDLIDGQHAPVPAFLPIMVDGKAIFRTLRGVRVVDAQSGAALWETRAGISPETILPNSDGGRSPYVQHEVMWAGGGGMATYYASSGQVNREHLSRLLFRNGTWGGISSDGEQLFVLEDHAVLLPFDPGNQWAVRNGISDAYRRDYSTNKIVAYDLDTGRPRWEIGGTAMDEPFDRRLAGQYFFGVPVADQDDLFAIGERDNEICLFALDHETGREKWSQLIAYSDASIDHDFGRRWWNAQVGVGQGVIVCPTTVGWLVGIDRLNRSVLWAYRYSKPSPEHNRRNFRGDNNFLVPLTNMNMVWGPSAPIIAGNRVVFTPPEDQTMVCLDLYSGEKVWSKQKDDFLYLAGVFDGQAVVVAKSKISAISMESGSTTWSVPLTEDDGKPCGMGVAVDSLYHLPLSSGQLWSIDLSEGDVESKVELPEGLPMLGNLGMYRGMLLSLSPFGMSAFSQRQAIEAEILARRKKDPADSWANLYEANIHILNKDYAPALKRLRLVAQESLSASDQTRYRELMVETLSAVIRSDFNKGDQEYAELRAFVKTEQEEVAFRRLTADRLRARGDSQSAFDEYLLLSVSHGSQLVSRDDDPNVTLSLDRWIAGRLEQLWREVSGDDRARLDERIAAAAEAARSQGIDQAQRFLVLFGFHPQAVGVRRALVEQFALAGEVALAENQLLKLSRNPDERVAAMALERLARLFREQGLSRDANYYYERLGERYPKVALADGTLVPDHLKQLKTEGLFGSVAARPVSWSDARIETQRTGTNYYSSGNTEHDLQYTPYRLPYFQDRRFHFFQQSQRLGVTLAATDEVEWIVPLKRDNGAQGNMMPSETSGHVLFVVHWGVLHALSPVDRKILWTESLDPRAARNVYYSSNQSATPAMQRNDQISPANILQSASQRNSTLGAVNSDYVCLLGRRMLSVHDTVTGRLRWTKDRLPANARVYGTDSLVFVVPPDSRKTLVLNAIDGSPVEMPRIGNLIPKAIRVLPEGFILIEDTANNSILGLTRGSTTIRYYSPAEDRNLWTADFLHGTYLSLMDDNCLVAVRPNGHIDLLDLETGRMQTMEGMTEADLQNQSDLRAVSDHANLYLIVNTRRQNNRFFYYGNDSNMPGIRVNGKVFAWSRETGQLLWKQNVANQQLMLTHFTHSPLLVFNTQTYKQVDNISFSAMSTLAIDKFTGQTCVDVTAPSNYSNFQRYDLSLSQRTLELRGYQLRIRMTALAPGSAESSPAVAE